MAKLIMHRHVRIAVFRFLFVNFADITSHFSHCLSTYLDDNSPYVITSTMRSHRHAFVAGVGVSTSGYHFSSLFTHRPLSTVLYVYGG